jgi:hypothetical protein
VPSEGPSATCVVGMTRLMTCQLDLRTLTQSQKTRREFDSEQLSLFQRKINWGTSYCRHVKVIIVESLRRNI